MIRGDISPWALAIAFAIDDKAKSMGGSEMPTSFTPSYLLQSVLEEHPPMDLVVAQETARLLNDISAAVKDPATLTVVTIMSVDGLLAVKAKKEPLSSIRFAADQRGMVRDMVLRAGVEVAEALPPMLQFLDLKQLEE